METPPHPAAQKGAERPSKATGTTAVQLSAHALGAPLPGRPSRELRGGHPGNQVLPETRVGRGRGKMPTLSLRPCRAHLWGFSLRCTRFSLLETALPFLRGNPSNPFMSPEALTPSRCHGQVPGCHWPPLPPWAKGVLQGWACHPR